ncbi:MAG: CDP-alcohol phosphatidyltransferase family protein [Phycisphaerales bacterium]
MTATPSDRRPIAARQLGVFQSMASSLAWAGVSPNAISAAGMVAGLGAGVCLALTSSVVADRAAWIAGAALIQLRLLANMMDGMVAERAGKTSKIGELFNEIPDRVSDSATLIGFGFAMGSSPMAGVVGALLAALTAYVRAVGKGAGVPGAFCGPMAKQQRMALVTMTAVFFAVTPHEFRVWSWKVPGLDANATVPVTVLWIICIGCVFTCSRRLHFIIGHLRSRV